ncbi:MFS transporter, partial [bacterium]|nr:MFS transporter [bacterium]
MKLNVGIRLSVMMLFQYWVWGAWGDYLPIYLSQIGFDPLQRGWIMSMLFLASMFAPFIGGQITDRYMAGQKYLAISQIICGVLMLLLVGQTSYWPFLMIMFVWSVFYAPTLPLTNAICFHNLDDVDREFGWIRVWGTIGWILAGFALSFWLSANPDGANCIRLSGYASIIMGIFCFFLPSMPPQKNAEKPFAFLEALKLLKDPTFLTFMIISFVVATELMFYYVLTGVFLMDLGLSQDSIPSWMRLAQIAEIISLTVFLPWVLPKLGIKKAMMIGILSWPIRYIIF